MTWWPWKDCGLESPALGWFGFIGLFVIMYWLEKVSQRIARRAERE